MSEKETPESNEEQTRQEEVAEAVEKEAAELEAETTDSAPAAVAIKKGLMERRESFDQSSVPNAHKGYSPTPPVIMLLIVSAFIVVSLIFATAAVVSG